MKMKPSYWIIALVFLISSCSTKIESGVDVIKLMKEKYNNEYLQNFTFSQYVVEFKDDSIEHKTVWHEAYTFPNQLVIKFDSLDSGKGYIFKNDTVYIMQNNKVAKKYKNVHDLLILGFDIYGEPVQTCIEKLTENGYDLSKVCEAKLNGKSAYCVGVSEESEQKNKFYIDKENLYFLKMVSFSHDRYGAAEFANYKNFNGKPIATKVLFYNNEKLIMTEDYFNLKFPEELDSKIYDPEYFEEAKW